MYKNLSLDEIKSLKSTFLNNLKKIYEKEWFIYFKQFFKKINDDIVDEVLYFSWSKVFIRIILKESQYEIVDESSWIRLKLNNDSIKELHNLLKKKIDNKWKKNIANTLINQFEQESMKDYLWKDFLVYDIETIWNIENIKDMKFMMAYVIDSKDFQKWNPPKYKYVCIESLNKFVDYLYNYDGYIVGYNNISFDNPVSVYNSSINEKDKVINELNKKTLDLFLLYSKIFWKKIWLNAVATNIVWVSKTLDSWAEWTKLLKQYEESWDKKALNKVKNYCKNDVKMTLTILLYLLFNWQICYKEKDININKEYILNYWCLHLENENKNNILTL